MKLVIRLLAIILENAEMVHKVTIIPRGQAVDIP